MYVHDHLGNRYKTVQEMCKVYGVSTNAYLYRLKAGYTKKEALTGDINNNSNKANTVNKKVYDHLGNKFNSITEMCTHYGIKSDTFYARLRCGDTLEQALRSERSKNKVYDHLGNEFNSTTEMCKHYGVRLDTFSIRLKRGDTLEQALRSERSKNKVYDHLGNEFNSATEMCKAYNMTIGTYNRRINKGWDLEKTLTTPIKQYRKEIKDHLGKTYTGEVNLKHIQGSSGSSIKCQDHLGNKFNSIKEMCKAYNITSTIYGWRVSNGWDIEKALTTPANKHSTEICDHKGNKYKSIADMSRAYGKDPMTVVHRLNSGWDVERALTA